MRDHPGFSILEPRVLPCRSKSLERLASLLGESPLIGRLGSPTDYPLDEFRALATRRAELALPGWPLLAAVLRSVERDIDAQRIVEALNAPTEQHQRLVVDHLNALAVVSQSAPEPPLLLADMHSVPSSSGANSVARKSFRKRVYRREPAVGELDDRHSQRAGAIPRFRVGPGVRTDPWVRRASPSSFG